MRWPTILASSPVSVGEAACCLLTSRITQRNKGGLWKRFVKGTRQQDSFCCDPATHPRFLITLQVDSNSQDCHTCRAGTAEEEGRGGEAQLWRRHSVFHWGMCGKCLCRPPNCGKKRSPAHTLSQYYMSLVRNTCGERSLYWGYQGSSLVSAQELQITQCYTDGFCHRNSKPSRMYRTLSQ